MLEAEEWMMIEPSDLERALDNRNRERDAWNELFTISFDAAVELHYRLQQVKNQLERIRI